MTASMDGLYKALAEKLTTDLGPSAMHSPIHVKLVTGDDKIFLKPRYLFDTVLNGVIDMEDITEVQLAGETYVRHNMDWITTSAPSAPSAQSQVKIVDVGGKLDAFEEAAAAYEEVDHPRHYALTLGGINYDAIDLIEAMDLGFHVGNALKYIVRAGTKPGEPHSKDLRKAIWYLSRAAGLLEEDGK